MFRVLTSAVVTELLRFDITFLPSGNAIQLVNHTLVVREGHSQQVFKKIFKLFPLLFRSVIKHYGLPQQTIPILYSQLLFNRFLATLNY